LNLKCDLAGFKYFLLPVSARVCHYVEDGNTACIDMMRNRKMLIAQEPYPHKYPYDWRTKKPTIFRATEQWFASVAGFREQALAELENITFIPASGSKRMTPMVSGRNDWCISRQRSWWGGAG
jgi:isoleucyl-tRNA synthetase